MKLIKRTITAMATIMVGWVLLQLCSCTTYHFEYPQPIDAANIYEFPKSFRGIWIDSTDKEKMNFIIDKKYLALTWKQEVIYNGILDSIGKNESGLKHITYNKQKMAEDTVADFLIKGNRIYELESRALLPGRPFTIKNDSIYPRQDTLVLNLGPDNFLREISKGMYMLNMNEASFVSRLLDDHAQGLWWQIAFIRINPDGNFQIALPEGSNLKDENLVDINTGDKYIDVRWTKQDLIRMITVDKIFSDGALIKVKNKKR